VLALVGGPIITGPYVKVAMGFHADETPTDEASQSSDVAAYQEFYGVDAATADAEIRESVALGELQERLEAAAPSQYAGLWIEHKPYRVVIAVTEFTDAIWEIVASAELRSTPAIVTVDKSWAELDAAVRSISSAAASHNSYVDVRQNAVVVEVLEGDERTATDFEADASVTVVEVKDLGAPASHGGDLLGGLGGEETTGRAACRVSLLGRTIPHRLPTPTTSSRRRTVATQ
jgi:hypothetical protein